MAPTVSDAAADPKNIAQIGEGPVEEWTAVAGGGFVSSNFGTRRSEFTSTPGKAAADDKPVGGDAAIRLGIFRSGAKNGVPSGHTGIAGQFPDLSHRERILCLVVLYAASVFCFSGKIG